MKRNQQASRKLDKPNFLVILVDEERYPPVYENAEIKKWRKKSNRTGAVERKLYGVP